MANNMQYIIKYNKEHYKRVIVQFNNTNDDDVKMYNFLNGIENKSCYIKKLIEKDMMGE